MTGAASPESPGDQTAFRRILPDILTAIGLAIAPYILPYLGFSPDTANRIVVAGLFGIGFDILFGYTGLLSFGQSAFFGTGGFTAAYLLVNNYMSNVVLGLLVGMVAAAFVGVFVGLIALRRTGIYFAMITVAIAEVFFFLENSPLSAFTGGENGLPGVPTPVINLGFATWAVQPGWSTFRFIAICFFIGMVIARRIVASPVGAILMAIRDNPARTQALGHSVAKYKLTAFVIASAYAGFAGGLLGVLQGYMPPDAFTFDTSGELVIETVIGGAGTLFGPLVGATFWLYLRDILQGPLHFGASWRLVLGVLFVLLVFFLRHGIIGGIKDLIALSRKKPHVEPPEEVLTGVAPVAPTNVVPLEVKRRVGEAEYTGPVLETRNITKRYGGLLANKDISFTVNAGELRGVIGPNGGGQEHLLQDADLRGAANLGSDPVPWRRHHRQGRLEGVPARPHQELPGEPAVQPADGAPEHHHRPRSPSGAGRSGSISCAGCKASRASASRSRRRWPW